MELPIWVEIVNKLATPGIAAVSAFYVYLQYRRSQKWKAADLAQTLLQKLDSDQALALACQALDWGVGPLIIPDQYRPLFHSGEQDKTPAVMQHDPKVMCVAVEPYLDKSTLLDPRGLVYRYCFIKLFSYFDNMYKLVLTGQLFVEDISEVRFWLQRIQNYIYAPPGREGHSIFQPTLYAWEYNNVVSLGELLNVTGWSPEVSVEGNS